MTKSLMGGLLKLRNQASVSPPIPYSPGRAGGMVGLVGSTSSGDALQNMSAMGSVGTLFAIVDLMSTSTAAVEWHLYKKSKSGDPSKRVEVTSHPMIDLWQQPNAFYTGVELVETCQQHVDLTGECWLVLEQSSLLKRQPLGMWPVRPDRIEPIPSRDHFLAGYLYRGPSGEKIPLGLDQVVGIRMPNPLDPYRGMGPVQSILADAESVKFAMDWNRNFFANGAEPGGMIEVDRRLSDDEFDEMRARWNEGHRGVSNAHRVAIIEQGKWVDRKFSHNDMQFAELRQVGDDAMRRAFKVHPHMLGDSDDVNLANATAAEVTHARRSTVPRANRWRGLLNNDLLPMFGDLAVGYEWDYDNPVAEDEATDSEVFLARARGTQMLVNSGFDGDAAAAAAGLPPIPFDRKDVTQSITEAAFAPAAGAPAPADDADSAANSKGLGDGGSTPPKNIRRHVFRNATERPDPAVAPTDIDLGPVQEAWAHSLDMLIGEWTTQITPEDRRKLAEQVHDVVASGDLNKLSDLQLDTKDAKALLETAMGGLADISGRHVVQEAARQSVELEAKTVEAAKLSDWAGVTADLLAMGLKIAAARAAMRVAGDGVSADEVKTSVKQALAGLSDAELRKQLGGALTAAQNAGRFATMAEGPEASMYASEVNDTNTCPPCSQVDGRWLGNTTDMDQVNSMYPSSGYVDCEGGPRCRGTVVAVWRPATVAGDDGA